MCHALQGCTLRIEVLARRVVGYAAKFDVTASRELALRFGSLPIRPTIGLPEIFVSSINLAAQRGPKVSSSMRLNSFAMAASKWRDCVGELPTFGPRCE